MLRVEVDEAVDFIASMPSIAHPLQLLRDVGLGDLTPGQPSPTLPGGEALRNKGVTELSKGAGCDRAGLARRPRPPMSLVYVGTSLLAKRYLCSPQSDDIPMR